LSNNRNLLIFRILRPQQKDINLQSETCSMNLRLIFIALIAQFLMVTGSCQVADTNAISNEQFKQISMKKDVVILDVRTTEEFESGHIENAIHIDVLQGETFKKSIASLPKDKTYLLYCRSGKRSSNALNIMRETGFTSVKHLQKGIVGWDGAIVK
jgi:rhodanese-related sulfurtransferase